MVMRILRHRATRHFVAVLVRCACGRKFLHRLDRSVVACLECGRMEDLDGLVAPLRAKKEKKKTTTGRRVLPRAARRSRARERGSARKR
jgi:hypothetical protein